MQKIVKGRLKECKRIMRLVQVGMKHDEVGYLLYNNITEKIQCNVVLKKGVIPSFQNELFYICQFRKESRIGSALKKWN